MVSFVCPCCPWFYLAPKVFQLCTNHLVSVLCISVWVSEACQLFLVPSRSSSMPSTPPKCYEPRNAPRLFILLLFFIWDSHLNRSRSWECVIEAIVAIMWNRTRSFWSMSSKISSSLEDEVDHHYLRSLRNTFFMAWIEKKKEKRKEDFFAI